MREFAHLHLHTEYSLLDGMGRVDEYMRLARDYGMRHIAISDHGVMYGAVDWYRAAREHELHPIIGVEAYLAQTSMQERERGNYHLLLLAENQTGYQNLLKLTSKASLEGFYYRPRIDLDLLGELNEGIIATSACLGGPVASNFLEGNDDEAVRLADALHGIFGSDRFFLEVQEHGIQGQTETNRKLVELARAKGLPLVASNDVHYVHQEDAGPQELLVCIQTNSSINDPKRMRMDSDQLYFKSQDEMWSLFEELPEALENTIRIAERCNVDLEFGRLYLPDPGVPDGLTPHEHLTNECWTGVRQRYPELTEEVRQRLQYELDVIEQTGFSSYMLIVRDFSDFARERKIPFGVRGSAAASIVLYSLGITDIEPLANRLVFERFLNLERREMPDIDMDFADNRRGEVIDYVARKYGHDHVAQIITFGTMGAKAVVRDVGRAMGWAYGDVDRIARLIPSQLNITLDRALEESTDLRQQYESNPDARDLIDTAKRLEGISRHAGTHAAGVVISDSPLIEHLPLQRPHRNDDGALPTTQFTMETVADIGLLKMDFLGLANLTILGEAVEVIRQRHGVEIDPKRLPEDDHTTFEMLSNGETFGVFQLESAGMRRYIRELRPGSIAELAAMVALYRPGPMQHIPTFCKAKHGDEPIRYPHPDLAEVLDETYGVIVYQDQVLLIAQKFAGYTLGEADIMRKAMGKKIPEKMAAERKTFISGAVSKGYSEEDAEKVFRLIEPFAGYAFNKAHAVCYGTISYQTAYLKANYPAEYMTAVLRMASSHPAGATQRVAAAVAECTKLGIPVLPPCVNRSDVNFTVETLDDGTTGIRFGLSIIKNCGEGAVRSIVDARRSLPGGEFTSFQEFCDAVDWSQVNRRTVEALIKCGAFDVLGERSGFLSVLEQAIGAAQNRQRASQRGQTDLFASLGDAAPALELTIPDVEPVPESTMLQWEKEHLGLYLSSHPLRRFTNLVRDQGFIQIAEISDEEEGEQVDVIGLVSSVRKIATKSGSTMAIIELEDMTGSIEMVFFPRNYDEHADLLEMDTVIRATVKIEKRNDQLQLVTQTAAQMDSEPPPPPEPVRFNEIQVSLPVSDDLGQDVELMRRLRGVLEEFPGDDRLVLTLPLNGHHISLTSGLNIDWCFDVEMALTELIGDECVNVNERVETPRNDSRAPLAV